MKLLETIQKLNLSYKDDVAYLNVNGFDFFYCVLKNNKEVLGVCLNKSLIHKNDLKVINKKFKSFAKVTSDNAALKSDVLYISFKDYDDINEKLINITNFLRYINYHQRGSCIMCGCKANNVAYKNKLIPIDDKCMDRLKEEEQDFINSKKFVKKSIIYSLLGSIIGITPSLIIALLVQSYTIVSTILLFISPFLSLVLFNINKVKRITKNDIICAIISFVSILIYHGLLVLVCIKGHDITSLNMYIETFKYLLIESIIETVFVYAIGYASGIFLIKKKAFVRFQKS